VRYHQDFGIGLAQRIGLLRRDMVDNIDLALAHHFDCFRLVRHDDESEAVEVRQPMLRGSARRAPSISCS